MGWTQERTQLLRKLWAEGYSASQIAKQLGGVTRNAVIGKVHRLGLAKRGRLTMRATYRPPKFAQRARAEPSAPKVKKSLVLQWRSGPPPAPAKPPVKVDPNSPASLAAAALLGVAAATERRNDEYRARGVNLSW